MPNLVKDVDSKQPLGNIASLNVFNSNPNLNKFFRVLICPIC